MPREFWPAMRHVLWRYDPSDPLNAAYHWLNVAEAGAWFGIAGYVAWRFAKHRKSAGWELGYAALFLVFGASDVWESRQVPMWLIAAKGVIFLAIVLVRREVLRRCYPDAKF